MNPLKRLAGQTAIYGLSSILGRMLNYLLVPIYTRVFLPAEFGVIAELYAYIAFLNVVLTYGMETSFFRHYKGLNKDSIFSTSFLSVCISSVLFIILVLSFSQSIATLIRYDNNREYIVWLAIIVALDALNAIPFAKLRAENKAKLFAFVKLFGIGLNIGFNLFFIVLCPYVLNNSIASLEPIIKLFYNTDTGVGYVLISNLIASGITLVLLLPVIFKTKITFNKQLWREMIIYALPLLIAGFAGVINETIDRVLLKFLLPSDISMTQLGIYSACYKISIIISIFIQAFKFAADPFFFSQSENKNAKDIYAMVMKYFVILCLLIFLIIVFYIDFVKYFVGKDYHAGLQVVPILLLANIFLGIYYNLSIWYKLFNKTIYGAYFSIIGAVITILLNLLWIPIWGYIGAAWATLICYFVMMVLSYMVGQKYYKINYDTKRLGLYFLLTIIMYGLSELAKDFTTYNFIINNILLFVFMGIIIKYDMNSHNKKAISKLSE